MGVMPQANFKWERGQSLPDLSILSDLCRVLNVSADLLLGLEYRNFTENNDADIHNAIFDNVLNNIRTSLKTVAIIFGIGLVQVFIDEPYGDLVAAERMQMSKEGFLLMLRWSSLQSRCAQILRRRIISLFILLTGSRCLFFNNIIHIAVKHPRFVKGCFQIFF